MNYDDELERARAKRSRKRDSGAGVSSNSTKTSGSAGTTRTTRTSQTSQSASGTRSTYRRRKKKNQKKKIVIGIVFGLVAVILAAAIGIYAYFSNKVNSMDREGFSVTEVQNINIPEEKREQMEKGYLTVAVFGVDSRDNSLGKGNQSDVIMIVNLNRETGEIKLVSVYRDTYLNISDKNTYNKINAAYASGGPEAAVKAINKNLDLNISHYATFNWKAVATVINILGGVEIDISQSEFYYINAFITETVTGTGIGSTQLSAPGVHNLDGVQAVAYGRLRLMDTDYARTERQRIIIQKAFEKLKSADLATINSVVGHVMEMSATNVKWEELLSLATGISKYHLGETTGFPSARGEVKIKIGSNNLSCVVPQTLESNVISLHNFLYGDEEYTPSSVVKEISAKIASVSGLATAGEEIGHVAVDQGYVPKATTTAAPATEATKATETSSETSTEETSESESVTESGAVSTEGESESTEESESSTDSALETESSSGTVIGPGGGPGMNGPSPFNPTVSEGPNSPADVTKESTESVGPGGAGQVPEATTEAETTAASPSGGSTSVIISPSAPGSTTTSPSATTAAPSATTAAPSATTAAPSATLAPSTTTDTTVSGPAAQATTAVAPGA